MDVCPWPRRFERLTACDFYAQLMAASAMRRRPRFCIRGECSGRPPGLAGGQSRKSCREMRAMGGKMWGAVQDAPSTCVNAVRARACVMLCLPRRIRDGDYRRHRRCAVYKRAQRWKASNQAPQEGGKIRTRSNARESRSHEHGNECCEHAHVCSCRRRIKGSQPQEHGRYQHPRQGYAI